MLERKRNMTGDEELDVLLDEIPHATSSDHHRQQLQLNGNNNILLGHGMYSCPSPGVLMHDDCNKYTCASPMSGFSLRSDGSSLSLFSSAGLSPSANGSPNPSPLEEFKSQMHCGNSHSQDEIWLDWKKSPNSPVRRNANGSWTDELGGLARTLSKMYIGNEQEGDSNFKNFLLDSNRLEFCDQNGERFEAYEGVSHGSTDCVGFHSPVSRSGFSFDCEMGAALVGLHKDYRNANLSDSQMCHGPGDSLCGNQTSNFCHKGSQVLDLSTYLNRLSMADSLLYAQLDPVNWSKESEGSNLQNRPQWTCENPHISLENMLHYGLPIPNGRTGAPSSIRIPQAGLKGFNCEDSFIIQGEGLNYAVNKGFVHSKGQNKGTLHDIGLSKHKYTDWSQLHGFPQIPGILENAQSARMCSPVSLPLKYNSMEKARGYVYLMAKDQHGCRFLQRMFDEGTPQDVHIISNEVVNHITELMINPFGNYLVQKLLEICNDEQRTQIVLILTQEPGQLVRISLNTHGTRVVQKLIETLRTRQQISLLVSALEPGFLALIKDLNGNHVIQHCLQCLSNDDNKFIFVAAAKYCVDIATHQHGCCVLQRCIGFSTGKHRQNLVAEISANGLLLAQDAYGNYVVQFVLELKLPSATSKLISHFEGNYVHLSTQKFSSHVVEKCLLTFTDESRSRIIRELLSAPHFEHLLQDPHANYVVQTALRVSEGPLHDSLVEAIESHKAISRNSPYSKRIFSQKLLKK